MRIFKLFDLQKTRFEESNKIQLKNKYLIQDAIAQNQLNNLLIQPNFFPHTKFSLSYTNVLHILNDVLINNKKNIVEFGSGYSTIMLSKLIKINNLELNVLSIDVNQNWIELLKKEIDKDGTSNQIKLITSPLVHSETCYDSDYKWHDPKILEKYLPNSIDLLIVDGPEAGKEFVKYSRYPAIPYLKEKLSKNCSIYLDDVNRIGEIQILKKWENELNFKFSFLNRYAYFNDASDFMSKPF